MSKIVFTTKRLAVRRWRDSDLDAILAVYGDAKAMQWVDDGEPITLEEALRWLDVTRSNYEQRGYGMFAVEMPSSPEVIGFCGIVHPDGQKEAEIKYAYRRSYWGRGIATEIARGVIEYGAKTCGLDYMIATTAPENTASHQVLLKAGMKRGELRDQGDGSQTQLFYWRTDIGET
ncbi:MAG: GNAT family N-acetyltransferase [Cyanobacteria bacterium P01_D01_bin.115]